MNRVRFRQHRGFTIVELLVSIAIIGVLMALLLPAVQSVREGSRQVECRNRLHNFGIAMHAFESSHRHFPPRFHERDVVDSHRNPLTIIPHSHAVSPHYSMLPQLDLAALQAEFVIDGDEWLDIAGQITSTLNQPRMERLIPAFLCPSDSSENASTNYMMNSGTSGQTGYTTPGHSPPNTAALGILTSDGMRPSQIADGLSNTAAMSERILGDRDPTRYTPARDVASLLVGPLTLLPDDFIAMCQTATPQSNHSSLTGYGWLYAYLGRTLYNHILEPNSKIPDCTRIDSGLGHLGSVSPRSWHPGMVHLLMCDGSVKTINDGIDRTVWRAIGTSQSHEVFTLP